MPGYAISQTFVLERKIVREQIARHNLKLGCFCRLGS
jgi:hypothetical protein